MTVYFQREGRIISLIDEEQEVRYWTFCPLMKDNSAGQGSLKTGTHELKLYHPPVVMPNPPGGAERAEDSARLHVCVFSMGSPPNTLVGAKGSSGIAEADTENRAERSSVTEHDQYCPPLLQRRHHTRVM